MKNRTSDKDQSERGRPALILARRPSEAAEDNEAMEMYAAMLPRAHILGSITRRHLMIAGGFGLLVMGLVLTRHLVASDASAAPAQSGQSAIGPAAAPAPSLPATPAAIPVAAPAPAPAAAPAALAPLPTTLDPKAVAKPTPKPQQAVPPTEAAEGQNVEGCRQALKRRDIKQVSVHCDGALGADPSLVKPLLALAKAQFENGRAAKAAVWARKIVQVNSSLADAYLIIGVAEQEALNPAAAKSAYQRYLRLAPNGPFADDVRSSLKSL